MAEKPPVPVDIPPPDFLDEAAKGKWADFCKRFGWLPNELDALAGYCAAWSRWRAAEAWLSEPGHAPVMTIQDDKGNVKSHGVTPQVAVSERSQREMARLSKVLRLARRR